MKWDLLKSTKGMNPKKFLKSHLQNRMRFTKLNLYRTKNQKRSN